MKASVNEITKTEFCTRYGMSTKQFERYVEQGLQVERRANRVIVPMPLGWIWYKEYLVGKGKKDTPPTDFEAAKTRKMAAEAELAELELAQARNELMTVTDYEEAYADAILRVDAKLRSVPIRLAGVVLGATTVQEAKERIDPLVEEVRDELRHADDVPDDDAGDGDDGDDTDIIEDESPTESTEE